MSHLQQRTLGYLDCKEAFPTSPTHMHGPQMLEEMRETVPREFDFVREARLMKALGERLRAAGHACILVPEPVSALTSQRLLVMQRMQGTICRTDKMMLFGTGMLVLAP